MLATRARLPWLLALAGIGAAAGVMVTRGLPPAQRSPHQSCGAVAMASTAAWIGAQVAWTATDDAAPTYVHVQLAHADAELVRLQQEYPLFSTVGGAGDARRAWLRLPVQSAAHAQYVAAYLDGEAAEVAQAFVEPLVTLPTLAVAASPIAADDPSCPLTTPSYAAHQEYAGPAPGGIDAPAAWSRGHTGAGVGFADIEGNWNPAHEDLPGARITHVGGRRVTEPGWREHGTAVLGEVVGRDNALGVTGLAPAVDRVVTASFAGIGVADAIDRAAGALHAGDVLLVELQSAGPRGHYIPVEYWDDVYLAITLAVARGITVVEAAGNGFEDLDHPIYDGKFDPAVRDSGAILVGAGAPPRPGFDDRTRLDFSNHGERVDVQGWGRKVATLDYGDLQACADGGDRHYTGEFAGTSSASPIVAGAAILLQSAARSHGVPLSPRALRALLHETGTPQTGDTSRWIGPRPDLARAFAALESSR